MCTTYRDGAHERSREGTHPSEVSVTQSASGTGEPSSVTVASAGATMVTKSNAYLSGVRNTDIGQPPEEQALSPADFDKRASQHREVVTPLRPIRGLPDVKIITVIHAGIMVILLRRHKKITA